MMHGHEKSDPNIVAVKPANKAARSATSAGLLLVADAIPLHVMWPLTPAGRQHLA